MNQNPYESPKEALAPAGATLSIWAIVQFGSVWIFVACFIAIAVLPDPDDGSWSHINVPIAMLGALALAVGLFLGVARIIARYIRD